VIVSVAVAGLWLPSASAFQADNFFGDQSRKGDEGLLGGVGLEVTMTGGSIPADPATEPDPSRGSGGAAAETVADDWEPPCVARDRGSGSPAGNAGSLSADDLAARGIESPETTQNHLDAVIHAGAGADTSLTNDETDKAGASSRASGEGLKDTAYMPVVVAAKPVKSASFWQDEDAEPAPSTSESGTAAVFEIWRKIRQQEAADNDYDTRSESAGNDEPDCNEFYC